MDQQKIKADVKRKYGEIALKSGSCCGGDSCCSTEPIDYTVMSESYSELDGYVAEADLGLGCGLPTQHAGIKSGDVVVDLGSGAGNDVFVARSIVGESGRVVGIDMTEEMIHKANVNNQKLGYKNIEFRLGEIEALPLPDAFADVVISNCVLNLVPDKEKAFAEIYRVLKPGGHFCISDIVLEGEMPDSLREAAELYAGCISGALQKDKYLGIIDGLGFVNRDIKSSKKIDLPPDILRPYLSRGQLEDFMAAEIGIFSITVVAEKPL